MSHCADSGVAVHEEPSPGVCRFAEIPRRDNVQMLPPHLSVVVELYEARCVLNMMRALPVLIPHPIELDPPYVFIRVWLRVLALRHRASTSCDKVYAL